MKRLAALAALAALAGCASMDEGRGLRPVANPSAVVAAELAFARLAQEKGQWTAFRKYATADAVMFMPQPVNARDWLARQTDPPEAVKWQPTEVWASCDGSLAVSHGNWQRPDGSTGTFTTIWQRRRDEEYRWVLDQAEPAPATPVPADPDAIASIGAKVADCPAGGPRPASSALATVDWGQAPGTRGAGRSVDGTLAFEWALQVDGGRLLTVTMRQGNAMPTVFEARVPAGS